MSGLDIIIRGGTVIDGTGSAGKIADIGIAGGRIAEIGKITARGKREIDAEGHAVTPGFIDGHTHMDAQMHWDPIGTNSCWHGVTSVIMGNCGFSVAPLRRGQQHLVTRNLERAEDISAAAMRAGINWAWEGFDEYLDTLETLPKGINYAAYIGHSALRSWTMGERAFEEQANEDDLAQMQAQLKRALDAGAAGFSTSRSSNHETSDDRPVASRLASRAEVAALVHSMKGRKGAVFQLANESVTPDSPEGEDYYGWLSGLAAGSGVTTTFGVAGGVWRGQLAVMAKAEQQGGRMVGQGHSRGINTVASFRSITPFDKLPVWREFRLLPIDAQCSGLKDPATRQALEDAVKHAVYGRAIGAEARPPQWDRFWVYDTPLPPWRDLATIAAGRGVHPITAVIDIALENDLHTLFMQPLTMLPDEDAATMLRDPRIVMTFSDSGAHVGQIADASIQSHLIAYFCREKQLIPLPEAVEMMTSRAARLEPGRSRRDPPRCCRRHQYLRSGSVWSQIARNYP